MSWLVAIDESGNLGKDTRFFTMAAIIIRRANILKGVYKKIPHTGIESKYYNTTRNLIKEILIDFSNCDVRIVFVVVDKYDYRGAFYEIYGNDLYKAVLHNLLDSVASLLSGSELHIILDNSSFISKKDAQDMAQKIAESNNCSLNTIEKRNSDQSPCIQVVDYIAGTIFRYFENCDSELYSIIQEKVVVARTARWPRYPQPPYGACPDY